MNAPDFITESAPTFVAAETPKKGNGLNRPSDDISEYSMMVRNLYFPPMPEFVWAE